MEVELLLRAGKRQRLALLTKRTALTMAEILGLRRLHDYLRPVWLMGVCFQNAYSRVENELEERVLAALVRHFKSFAYMTYRCSFSSEGLGDWTSDAGWGCTIRSGQMMMAQALLDHLKAPELRKASNCELHSADLASVVSLFWDHTNAGHLFSLHHICQAALKYGQGPGCWMAPGFVCRLLTEINNCGHPFGLHVALIAQPDGAPYLTPARINEFMEIFQDTPEEGMDAAKGSEVKGVGHESVADEVQSVDMSYHRPGLVLFVPLVLGVTKIDHRYLQQLKTILKWPQSIGFIGGRANSSLYFVGFQEDNLIYLDPHKIQTATLDPHELPTYFNSPLRHMPISTLITSLAIGFYCKSKDELQDLMTKLSQLEKDSDGAPILSFLSEDPAHTTVKTCTSDEDSDSASEISAKEAVDSDDDWEII